MNATTRSRRADLVPRPSVLGVALALTHFVLLVFFAATRPDIGPPPGPDAAPPGGFVINPYNSSSAVVAGRVYDFAYEPLLLKIITILDLPSSLLGAPIAFVSRLAGVRPYAQSWVEGLSWLFLGSLQWLWIGSFIAARRRRSSGPSSKSHAAA